MKKYIEIAKILFRVQMIYRFAVVMTALSTVARVLFAWILWGAVFSGRDYVGDFTFQAMLSYYVVSSFLATGMSECESVSGEVSARIRNGTFSKYLVVPANVQGYFMFETLGAVAYYTVFSFIAAVFCTLVFHVDLMFTGEIAAILCAAAMIIIGFSFMVSYHYFIGLLTLQFQDVGFFLHVQGNIIAFVTGALVPLSLLPDGFTAILRFVPFYYVTYMPAMLLTGQAGVGEGLPGLVILALWAVAAALTAEFTYQKLRVKYDGVGI
ncbi:ABC transporter permease [Spirochaetia bacterium]|nr:ABC transporter permease [Spirochaetia bacterium]